MQNQSIPEPFNLEQALLDYLTSSTSYGNQLKKFITQPQCWEEVLKIIDEESSSQLLEQAFRILSMKLQSDILQLSQIQLDDVTSQLKKYLRQSKYLNKTNLSQRVSKCVSLIIYHEELEDLDLLETLDDWFDHEQILIYKYQTLQNILHINLDQKVNITLEKKQQWKDYIKNIKEEVINDLRGDDESEISSFSQVKLTTIMNCLSLWIAVQPKQDESLNLHNHPVVIYAFQQLKNLNIYYEIKHLIKQVIRSAKNEQSQELFNFIKPIIDELSRSFGAHGELQKQLANMIIQVIYFFLRTFRQQYLVSLNQDIILNECFCKYIQIMDNQTYWNSTTEQYFVQFCSKFTHSLLSYPDNYQIYTNEIKRMTLILVDMFKLTIDECESLQTLSTKQLASQNDSFDKRNQNFIKSQQVYQNIIKILTPIQYVSFIRTQIEILNNIENMDKEQFECNLEGFMRCLIDLKLANENTLKQNHEHIDSLVEFILQQEFDYKVLRSSSLSFLSQMFPFYSSTEIIMSQKVLKHIFKYLNTDLKTMARKQIRNICLQNKTYVLNNLNMFIDVFKQNKGSQLLIEGLINVLITDVQKLKQYLPQLFDMTQGFFNDQTNAKHLKMGLGVYQKVFTTINQNAVNTQDFLDQYFVVFWKQVRKIFEDQCQNHDLTSLIQKCAKITKYGLRALKSKAELYLKQIYEVVINCYFKRPLSSYVYLVQVFITIHSNLKDSSQLLTHTFNQTIKHTFKHFQVQQNLDNNELVQDFIGMVNRSLNFCPQIFFNSQHFSNILKFAFKKQNINSKQILRMQIFIADLYIQYCSSEIIQKWKKKPINYAKMLPQFNTAMLQIKQKIKPIILEQTQKFLVNIIEAASQSKYLSLDKLAQALTYQVQAFPDQMKQIWNRILSKIPKQIFIDSQKQNLIQNINLRKYQGVTDLIQVLFSRLIHSIKIKI